MRGTFRELLPYAAISTVLCILIVTDSLMKTLYGLLLAVVIGLWYWVFWEVVKWIVFGWILGRGGE